MAELALGVAGVVPLIGLAVKSYRQVHSKLKTFVHYSKALKQMRKRLNLNRSMFELECHYLLRFAFDDEIILLMKADGHRKEWEDPVFEDQVQRGLGANYEGYMGLVEDVGELLEVLSKAIDRCTETNEGERLKDAMRRLKRRGKLTLIETEWEDTHKKLRGLIQDLTSLREKIQGLDKPASLRDEAIDRVKVQELLTKIPTIRSASSDLYHGICGAWQCRQQDHIQHVAHLFMGSLDVPSLARLAALRLPKLPRFPRQKGSMLPGPMEIPGASCTRLQLAMLCKTNVDMSLESLEVESQREYQEEDSYLTPSEAPEDGEESIQPPMKRAKHGHSTSNTLSSVTSRDIPLTPDNREDCTRICLDLKPSFKGRYSDCIGYLDTNSTWRHTFIKSWRNRELERSKSSLSLKDLFDNSHGFHFSVIERLSLALSVAEAAFIFQCTPWLKKCWRIDDFAVLSPSKNPAGWLRTLHLQAKFKRSKVQHRAMEPVPKVDHPKLLAASEDELLYHGVGDVGLYSLGVFLVSIDHWTRFEPDDLLGVRKAAQRSMLGPRYRDAVNRCLGYLGQDDTTSHEEVTSGQVEVFLSVMQHLGNMVTSLA
ncbi:hypothetical protein BKA56DRAFT_621701 [Ilyonectria sp. MPI-CAGE-AT-0026]|nr:hypothetical protein BKA56DRAFT_621701 [Ilyonectria sp. MPI-CAGE-AT-0026]